MSIDHFMGAIVEVCTNFELYIYNYVNVFQILVLKKLRVGPSNI